VLFSEPKIPQLGFGALQRDARICFSALQRAENSSISVELGALGRVLVFQCSSASRKFLNTSAASPSTPRRGVSVLFSEPKIPQLPLRRQTNRAHPDVSVLFSEPKIPQYNTFDERAVYRVGFSALQRAENSSMLHTLTPRAAAGSGFSALQRAENSSMSTRPRCMASIISVSVLFSEPKIPQSPRGLESTWTEAKFQCSSASRKFLNVEDVGHRRSVKNVSVLFSEPKIPQCVCGSVDDRYPEWFQCSSASRKFLNQALLAQLAIVVVFQCSSASRKFLNVIDISKAPNRI